MGIMRRISPLVFVAFSVALALAGRYFHIPGSELAPVVVAVLALTDTQRPSRRRSRKNKTNA